MSENPEKSWSKWSDENREAIEAAEAAEAASELATSEPQTQSGRCAVVNRLASL